MATLKTSIALQDNMSAKLRTINTAIRGVVKSIDGIKKVSDATSKGLQKMNNSMANGMSKIMSSARQTNVSLNQIKQSTQQTTQAVRSMGNGMSSGFNKVVASARQVNGSVNWVRRSVESTTQSVRRMASDMRQGFTSVKTSLNQIKRSTDGVTQGVRKMTSGMGRGFSAMIAQMRKANAQMVAQQRQSTAQLTAHLSRIGRTINSNTNNQRRFNRELKNSSTYANQLWTMLRRGTTAYFGIQGAKNVFDTADRLTMGKARINLMSDVAGGKTTTDEVQSKIYDAAMRSRGSYLDMMDSVSKLSLQTGNLFSGSDEVISFMENYNKMAVVSGANVQQTNAALLQITQSLASGELRGDELRSVLENMPVIAQFLAEELGTTVDQVRSLGHEGKISADVLRNAMLKSTKKVDEMYRKMPMTWGQVWQTISNFAIKASEGVLGTLSKIASNERFIAFANELGNIFTKAISVISKAFNTLLKPVLIWIYDKLSSIYGFIKNNWKTIAVVVGIVTAAFVALKVALIAYTAVASVAATVSAILASPLFAIALIIAAVVAAVYLLTWAFNELTGESVSATGIIAGALMGLFALIWNNVATTWNVIASLVEFFVNVWKNPIYSVKKLFVDLATSFIDLSISMTKGWDKMATNFANAMVDAINGVLEGWNWLVDKLGVVGEKLGLGKATKFKHTTSITSDMEGLKDGLKGMLGEEPKGLFKLDRMDYKSPVEMFNDGYNWGSTTGDGLLNGDKKVWDSALKDLGLTGGLDSLSNILNDGNNNSGQNDIGKALSGALGGNPLAGIAKDVGAIKENTAEEENMDLLKAIAEQEAINKHTTTNLNINMTNHNNMSSDVDTDSFFEKLKKLIWDEIAVGAEGSHI